MRRVPCIECGTPTSPGPYCPAHERENTHKHQRQQDHGRNTAAWRRRRISLLRKGAFLCQMRHPGCTEAATTVHLDPAWEGDHIAAPDSAFTIACAHCHGVEDGGRAAGNGSSPLTTNDVPTLAEPEAKVMIS